MAPARFLLSVAACAACLVAAALPAPAADVTDTALAMIPADAAFISSSLRLREQYDALVSSKAFAAVRKLPAVAKFFDSWDEQRLQPGSPLSIVDTFMQLPENQQAMEVLQDIVATETFVYGEPSCIKLIELLKKVQQAQQAANILSLARGDADFGDGIGFDVLEGPFDDDEEEDDDNAAAARRVPVRPVRFQVVDSDIGVSPNELANRLILKTVAENKHLLVIPDIVWGFATTKREAAETQVKRLEVLLKLAAQSNPDLADAVARKSIAGGEFLTFTFKPDMALLRLQLVGDEATAKDIDTIFDAIEEVRIVAALGVVGGRLVLSIGDSTDHIAKLVTDGGFEKGLLGIKPLTPLLEHRTKPITAVSYVSEAMMKAVAPSTGDIDQLAGLADDIVELAELPAEAADDARSSLRAMSRQYRNWLPVPGPWTAFSFRSEQGYEGYAWDWSQNQQFNGSKRLELLEHAGGAPLAAYALRLRTDVPRFDDVVSWIGMGWQFFTKHLLPQADEEMQDQVSEFDEHIVPLAAKFVEIVRRTFIPATANGQIGFVIDGKSRTPRLHKQLPAAQEPLPLIEPAIVLGLDDSGLFRDGMNELFALADDLVEAVREMNPESVPADYRIAEPEKTKTEGGSVWSWPLSKSGVDDQVRPSVALGRDAAVFSLVLKQAGRLIVETPLETGSQLTRFDEPLASAAALDFAGLVDAVEPWVVYLARYAAVRRQDGSIDPDRTLDADAEDDQVREVLGQVKVVLEAARSLRAATAETVTKPDATVTHWRNVIRDMK